MRAAVVFAVIVGLAVVYTFYRQIAMPLRSYSGPWLPLTEDEVLVKNALQSHVQKLAVQIGERNTERHYDSLQAAADYIQQTLRAYEYSVSSQQYTIGSSVVRNLFAEVPGTERPTEVIVLGAHYDSALGTPGANDNGSGVAALLELARLLRHERLGRTVRFAFFVNEEPPYFQTNQMGSLVYVRQLRQQNTNVVGMMSLETIGAYSDSAGSQRYPLPFGLLYPDKGNFVGFVADTSSRALLKDVMRRFRESVSFPSEGVAAPANITGVGWSDHWSFWQEGYPAIMVTDTAPFRYRYYHAALDTPDKLDFDRMARVVYGLRRVVAGLATVEQSDR